VQQILDWRVQDWIQFMRDTAPRLSFLLQMTTGSSSGYMDPRHDSQAVPHLLLAGEQLSKVTRCFNDVHIPVNIPDIPYCKDSQACRQKRGTVSHSCACALLLSGLCVLFWPCGRLLSTSACLPVPCAFPSSHCPLCCWLQTFICTQTHSLHETYEPLAGHV
jgi:hypothetical protein